MHQERLTKVNIALLTFFAAAFSINVYAAEGKFCDKLQAEIQTYIDEHKFCVKDSDCTIFTSCPFGCYQPIAEQFKARVGSMLTTHGELCGHCIYECIPLTLQRGDPGPRVKCIANQCQWTHKVKN